MDPNATLEDIIALLTEWEHARSTDQRLRIAFRLVEKVHALNEWLSRDGFIPMRWRS